MKQRYTSIIAALAFAALMASPAIVPADPPPVTPEVPGTTGTTGIPATPTPTPAPSVTMPPAAPAVRRGITSIPPGHELAGC